MIWVRSAACCTSTCFSRAWTPAGRLVAPRSGRMMPTLDPIPVRAISSGRSSHGGWRRLAFRESLHGADECLVSGTGHHHVLVPGHETCPGIVHVVEAGHERDHR